MLKKTILVRSLAVAFGGAAVLAAMPAMAQQQQGGDVQRVVVTGSLISRADKETPSPVQVLTADDIAKSGQTSIAEVLSNLTANGQGALGTGFAGAFANGGAGVSLRGLTVGLTLVLIDGHRMAPYPLSDDGQRQFVDVSSIPFDAVERIEVLKDGASSLYGSDAVSGVVNIILKKTFNGTNIKVDGGNTQHGGGKNYHVSLTHGFGDLNNDGYNAFAALEYRHADAIKIADRSNFEWANGDWTSRGGINLNPGVPNVQNNFLVAANTPFLYNPATGRDNPASYQFLTSNCDFAKYRAGGCAVQDTVSNIQPASHNVNLLAGFTKQLNEDWKLALKASMFKRESENNRGLGLTTSPTSFVGNISLVPGQAPALVNAYGSTVMPANWYLNKLGAPARLYGYLPQQDPQRTQDNTATSTRFAADLTGTFMGWDIAGGLGYSKVKTEIDYSGYVNRFALYTALNRATNPFNILGGNSQADMDAIAPHFSNTSEETLKYAEVHASRELAQLPGGPLALALGSSWTRKDLNAPPPSQLALGAVGNGAAFASGRETDTAVFAELSALPIKNVEVSASTRFDHYDTYGNSWTPGAKFKWTVMPQVAVRGTFARGFRAPNAAEVGTASSIFTFNAINDPILCKDGNPKTAGNVPSACGIAPTFVQVTTPNLSPEKSKSYTFGLILQPIPAFSSTVDYYKIDVKNQINTASGLPGFVPSFFRAAPQALDISNGDGTTHVGVPSVGQITYATSGYVNSGTTSTSGVEIDMNYRLKLGDMGTAKAQFTFNHLISYEIESAGTKYELAGTHGPSVVSGDTGNPKNRAQLTLGWDKGPLGVTTTFNWIGSYSNLDPSLDVTDCADVAAGVGGRNYFFNLNNKNPVSYCKTSSFMSTDLNVTYKLSKNLTLKGSILNLFDRQPPIDVATYGNAGTLTAYNASLHQAGAVGRYFNLGLNYTF
ncbi:TonB-dependent receptor [Pseudoduganella sp. RAF19]|uniref:TonB-dependent receptor n=3 Tax=unclassified Pseudoduganella TaxID=2637179 RepID=UPI003F986581